MDFQLTTNNIIFLNMMLTNKHIYDTLCSSKHGFICFLISYLIEVKNSDEFKNMEPIKEDDFLKSFTKIIEELRIKIKMDVLLSHTVEIQNNLFKINN